MLVPTCGPTGTSSCCESTLVPGGTFYRSYDLAPDGTYTDQSYPAMVSAFRLDTYEVTVGRFRRFVDAGMGTAQNPPPQGAGARTLGGMANQGGWSDDFTGKLPTTTTNLIARLDCSSTYQTWTDVPANNETLPVNCVPWVEAMAFCIWDGGFLPTEAEWNYAAAGGDEQRAFPWSDPASSLTIDCTNANYRLNSTTFCVDPPNGGANPVGSESPSGDGRWGHADLGGDLWEYTLDSYSSSLPLPCDDCANLAPASERAVRGGSYNDQLGSLRVANRGPSPVIDLGSITVGIRCARAP